jgi:hypothetical protein
MEFRSTQYPTIGKPMAWWHRPLPPLLSFIILAIIVIFVFLMGAWFVAEYIKIWSDITTTIPITF